MLETRKLCYKMLSEGDHTSGVVKVEQLGVESRNPLGSDRGWLLSCDEKNSEANNGLGVLSWMGIGFDLRATAVAKKSLFRFWTDVDLKQLGK
jgi:hypothetical protein